MQPLTISEDGLNVRISWLQPDNNGLPITGYRILIYNPSKIVAPFYEELPLLCDGMSSTVRRFLNCTIPMSTFIISGGYSPGQ